MQFVTTKTSVLIRAFLVLAVTLGVYTFLTTEAYAAFPAQLVPCGNDVSWRDDGDYYVYRGECDVCDLSKLGMNILNFLIAICVAVAALLFANAGFLYVTSSANPGNIARAHKMFTSTLIGLIAILAAYLLIDTVMKSLLAGGAGEVSGQGPWNAILCIGDTVEYRIKKLSAIKLEASKLVLPKVQCADIDGTCATGCTAGQTVQNGAECPSGQVCCGGNTSYSQFCVLSSAAGDSAGKTGTCTTAASCGENYAESSPACTGGLICCAALAQGGVEGDAYCSRDYLIAHGFPESDIAMAMCICEIESAGGTNPVRPSTCDICADTGVVVSHGLWQVNFSAHDVGGLDCTSTITPAYRGCTSTKKPPCKCSNCGIRPGTDASGTSYQDIYNACKSWVYNADNNTTFAVGLYNAAGGSWRDWAYSRDICLRKLQ